LFCTIRNAEKDGFGKVIHVESEWVVVEYFDSPAIEKHPRVKVPLSSITPKRLGCNTRVFIFDEISNQWRIGRVRHDDGEGIEVRLAHKQDFYMPYERVFVRWKRPIEDPVGFLGNFVTETPQYAEARSGFMRNYVYQRGAAFGISALLSSSIELESHQIEVVRRVLTDHTQRYLLADEVGLGKTIEAGIVIRQAVLDDMHSHRILVLVPPELVSQWREELIVRFGLLDFLDESVFVLPQEDSEELREVSHNLTLLVIDEAHHITAPNATESVQRVYCLVRAMAQRAERLLLLSATPILRNEGGFLRMLNLLDPVVYPLDDLNGFRSKVSNRQALAETVAALDPSNSFFMDSALDDLLSRLPNDPRLAELTQTLKKKLLDIPEETDPEFCSAVRLLRAHISETYRLNRRILRNRRTQIEGLTPERKGAELWQVEDSSMEQVESYLENWRVDASLALGAMGTDRASELEEFYWDAVRTLFEGLPGFLQVCVQRLNGIDSGTLVPFNGEQSLLDSIIRAIDVEHWMANRLERLFRGLGTLPEVSKIVIFCADERSANQIFQYLKDQRINVVRHGVDEKSECTEGRSWQEFLTNPAIRAIVCDHRAEEGINLQGGNKVIVHFDLPLQPNRVEQRMGRVDRYGAGNPVPSYVLLDGGTPLQMAWFHILDDGLGVFDRSISSLQYLVEDEIASLDRTLIHDGSEGFDALRERLAGPTGAVVRELRLIDQQDALDQLSPVPEQEFDELFDADADWREISDAMTYWIEKTLLFDKVKLPRPNGKPSVDDPFRFHYCSPDNGTGQSTLIPLSEFIDDFLGAIDFGAPGNRSTRPQSYPYVAHRPSAVKRGVRPLRYGAEFVESIRSFSDLDVRGRSYAMWRQIFGQFQSMEIRSCFRFDFLVETYLDEAQAVLAKEGCSANESAQSSIARRGDALFRPDVIQVWLDEEGDELPQEFIERYLSPRYAKEGGNGYIDKNLDITYLNAFKKLSPDIFTNWNERCERMRDKAIAIVRSKPEMLERQKASLGRALAEDEIRYAQLHTRIQSLDGREASAEAEQLVLEQILNEALHRGISSPSIKVDVAGVVFLTSAPVSLIEGYLSEEL
jgi:ATP-dependent helicase HepA